MEEDLCARVTVVEKPPTAEKTNVKRLEYNCAAEAEKRQQLLAER